MLSFLNEVASHAKENEMNLSNLAIVFTPCFFMSKKYAAQEWSKIYVLIGFLT